MKPTLTTIAISPLPLSHVGLNNRGLPAFPDTSLPGFGGTAQNIERPRPASCATTTAATPSLLPTTPRNAVVYDVNIWRAG